MQRDIETFPFVVAADPKADSPAGDCQQNPTDTADIDDRGDDGDQLGQNAFGEGHVGRVAGQGHCVAAHVDVGGQQLFQGTQILVGGAEKAHHEVGPRRCRNRSQEPRSDDRDIGKCIAKIVN